MAQEITIVDLVVGSGDNIKKYQFPVTEIHSITDAEGEEALQFSVAENPANFQMLLPIKKRNIVALATYDSSALVSAAESPESADNG